MFCVCLRQICGSYFYMIYMKISDEGLWELCLKGDMRAFRELYCRFCAIMVSSYFLTRAWWKIAYRIFLSN